MTTAQLAEGGPAPGLEELIRNAAAASPHPAGMSMSDLCKVCPAGKFAGAAAGGCYACRSGQYQRRAGATGCFSCPYGKFSVLASGAVKAAAAAEAFDATAKLKSGALAWAAGAAELGTDQCFACSPGRWSWPSKNGAFACSAVPDWKTPAPTPLRACGKIKLAGVPRGTPGGDCMVEFRLVHQGNGRPLYESYNRPAENGGQRCGGHEGSVFLYYLGALDGKVAADFKGRDAGPSQRWAVGSAPGVRGVVDMRAIFRVRAAAQHHANEVARAAKGTAAGGGQMLPGMGKVSPVAKAAVQAAVAKIQAASGTVFVLGPPSGAGGEDGARARLPDALPGQGWTALVAAAHALRPGQTGVAGEDERDASDADEEAKGPALMAVGGNRGVAVNCVGWDNTETGVLGGGLKPTGTAVPTIAASSSNGGGGGKGGSGWQATGSWQGGLAAKGGLSGAAGALAAAGSEEAAAAVATESRASAEAAHGLRLTVGADVLVVEAGQQGRGGVHVLCDALLLGGPMVAYAKRCTGAEADRQVLASRSCAGPRERLTAALARGLGVPAASVAMDRSRAVGAGMASRFAIRAGAAGAVEKAGHAAGQAARAKVEIVGQVLACVALPDAHSQ
jgi:hypothetical protein